MREVRPLPWRSWRQRQRDLGGQSLGWELSKPLPSDAPHHLPTPALSSSIRTTEWTPPPSFWAPVGLTLLGRADEVPDTPNTAIILALRFIQFHAHPLAAGELRGPAEPQRARLRKQGRIWLGCTLRGHDKITGTQAAWWDG